jgi:nitrogen fixation protein NifZ
MKPDYEYGDEVRLIRNIRNDGTYPGAELGELLMKRGAVGCVYDVGTYLQDQLIYRVHFLDEGVTVGCRTEELLPVDAPWIPNKYDFREVVLSTVAMRSGGEQVVSPGDVGEVVKIIREEERILYHARFNGHTFQVPEAALEAAPEGTKRAAPVLVNGLHAGERS